MKHNKKKKTLLAIAVSLTPTAMTMLVEGKPIEGGILMVMSAGMVVAYDYYDDKAKSPTLPDGIDEQTFEEIASMGADSLENLHDEYQGSQ